jgi:hypothetical protein
MTFNRWVCSVLNLGQPAQEDLQMNEGNKQEIFPKGIAPVNYTNARQKLEVELCMNFSPCTLPASKVTFVGHTLTGCTI